MKIAIVGCGAMGSVYAGLLADRGHEVLAIDRSSAHVDAMNQNGLRVQGASGDRTVRVRAFLEPPEEPMDWVIVAVKSAFVDDVVKTIGRLIAPHTVVITIQNGLGAGDIVASSVGPDRLIVGVAAAFGASLVGPGHAYHSGMSAIRLGAYAGLEASRLKQVIDVWKEAGFNAEAAGDLRKMQWEKLICNVAYSAPCTLTGLDIGGVLDDANASAISQAAAIEAWETAQALGVNISVEDPVAYVRNFGSGIRDAKPSVMQDHEKRRISEIEFINGAVSREAEKAGLKAPVNKTLTQLIKARESLFK